MGLDPDLSANQKREGTVETPCLKNLTLWGVKDPLRGTQVNFGEDRGQSPTCGIPHQGLRPQSDVVSRILKRLKAPLREPHAPSKKSLTLWFSKGSPNEGSGGSLRKGGEGNPPERG